MRINVDELQSQEDPEASIDFVLEYDVQLSEASLGGVISAAGNSVSKAVIVGLMDEAARNTSVLANDIRLFHGGNKELWSPSRSTILDVMKQNFVPEYLAYTSRYVHRGRISDGFTLRGASGLLAAGSAELGLGLRYHHDIDPEVIFGPRKTRSKGEKGWVVRAAHSRIPIVDSLHELSHGPVDAGAIYGNSRRFDGMHIGAILGDYEAAGLLELEKTTKAAWFEITLANPADMLDVHLNYSPFSANIAKQGLEATIADLRSGDRFSRIELVDATLRGGEVQRQTATFGAWILLKALQEAGSVVEVHDEGEANYVNAINLTEKGRQVVDYAAGRLSNVRRIDIEQLQIASRSLDAMLEDTPTISALMHEAQPQKRMNISDWILQAIEKNGGQLDYSVATSNGLYPIGTVYGGISKLKKAGVICLEEINGSKVIRFT